MTKIKRTLVEGGKLPTKGTEYAACYDAYAREAYIQYSDGSYRKILDPMKESITSILREEFTDPSMIKTVLYVGYKLGFKTEIPIGWEAEVVSRSSISNFCLALANGKGVIDSDFRGEWEVRFRVLPELVFFAPAYELGERVAQFKFIKSESTDFEDTSNLLDTTRNNKGFGSTGTL